jgi:hypothetical protein
MAGYTGVAQQQGAMAGYQTGGFQGGYGQQTPGGTGAQAGFSQQQWAQSQGQYGQQSWGQQQQMGWGQDQGQWNGQANWANGAASPRTGTPGTNMYPMVPQQHQQAMPTKQETTKRVEASKAAPTGDGMQAETYQRTLEYVQQCQSWSSPATGDYSSVMSPDSSSVKGGAKPKGSPGQSGTDSHAMPPPSRPPPSQPMGEPNKPVQDTGNMVIADMSSSLNTLMEENRYLHMMQ